VVAPQEVVVGFFGARDLEGRYPAALRIDAAEDVLDGAVLTSRIHGLQHDEQTLLVLRIKALLEVLYASALLLQFPGNVFLLFVMLCLPGIYRRQRRPFARFDPVAHPRPGGLVLRIAVLAQDPP
jgi:hypothetical protein